MEVALAVFTHVSDGRREVVLLAVPEVSDPDVSAVGALGQRTFLGPAVRHGQQYAWPDSTALTQEPLAESGPAIGRDMWKPGTEWTITRSNLGSLQVTYNGLPLYFFSGDQTAGDSNGVYTGWRAVNP